MTTLGLLAVVLLAVVVLGPPLAVGLRAHRRERGLATVATFAILEATGILACGFGLLALAFDGYVEDYGNKPAHTLGYAIPALVLGAATILGVWFASGRK